MVNAAARVEHVGDGSLARAVVVSGGYRTFSEKHLGGVGHDVLDTILGERDANVSAFGIRGEVESALRKRRFRCNEKKYMLAN